MAIALFSSPIGHIRLRCDGGVLLSVDILTEPETEIIAPPGSPAAAAARQLRAYFGDGFTDFDVPLLPLASVRGEVLRAAIVAIAPGETQSYGEVARRIASGPRAIGQACRRNPFPILVPCHRVVGSGGAIGHYSGGRGIATKTWLLDHERGGLL